ncbi:MAG: diaminopimelate decarboxylase [Anaerolineales bacterium]
MEYLEYRNGTLHCEGVALEEIAHVIKTPCYIYSAATLTQNYLAFDESLPNLPHQICFALKANSNLTILRKLADLGSGADVVSGGELFKALQAGIQPHKIVYSGVGKTPEEIRFALQSNILMFNVESESELWAIRNEAKEQRKQAPISIRVNPNVDPQTHPYIATGLKENKFGLSIDKAISLYQHAAQLAEFEIRGIACHIGSQLTSLAPFAAAFDRLLDTIQNLDDMGIPLQYIDLGGGLGIRYKDETPPTPQEYGNLIQEKFKNVRKPILLEPGRAICGNAGYLLTKIIYVKENEGKLFYIVDAGMNDLIRPSLYQAYHEIVPVKLPTSTEKTPVDVVGPICESGDFLAKNRDLPLLQEGDLLLVKNSGAYGFSMSSNYNARPRPAEILVDNGNFALIRIRENYEQLTANEINGRNSL